MIRPQITLAFQKWWRRSLCSMDSPINYKVYRNRMEQAFRKGFAAGREFGQHEEFVLHNSRGMN